MKFYNRTKELALLRETEQLSHQVAQFTIVSGRRRIGKTSLVQKAYEGQSFLYFFVARKSEVELCEDFLNELHEKLSLPILEGNVRSFAALFKYIMQLAEQQHITLFIDEFQDFYRVNPAVFSDMQNIWDAHKGTAKINLIVGGSVNTLLNKIFKDEHEPLYGRQTCEIKLQPFAPSVLKEIMHDYAPKYSSEDLLALYAFTGGVAKYVELFVDRNQLTKTKMLKTIFQSDSYFISEGKNMLIDEFGKEYGVYFSILSLIAQGKNTRALMSDVLGDIELSGYIKKLVDDYGLISKQQPLYEVAANKNVHYAINDPYLRFWFRFIHKYSYIIEAGGVERLQQIVERDYTTFTGKSLEEYFLAVMRESGLYTRLGYWHDRKGENEIDIVAEDELEHRVQFIEVKRQARSLDMSVLHHKVEVCLKALGHYADYQVDEKGLSMEDM